MASTSPDVLPFSTLIHMLTVKLSSTNLLWRNQVEPLLVSQDLFGYLDGSIPTPDAQISSTDGTQKPNPAYREWHKQDQKLKSLLLSSLTEEAMAMVIGCSTSRAVWKALESTFSSDSQPREFRLQNELHSLTRGSRSVSEYGRLFKTLCDQLAAIGRPLAESDKAHRFLRGLGPTFSAALMAKPPLPSFSELLSLAESFALFEGSVEATTSPTAAFVAHSQQSNRGRGNHHRGRGNQQNGGGRGRNNQTRGGYWRTPRCQICRGDQCPDYINSRLSQDVANLAEAFNANCTVNSPQSSYWYVDTGASAHMTSSPSSLDSYARYYGQDQVIVEPPNQGNHSKRQARKWFVCFGTRIICSCCCFAIQTSLCLFRVMALASWSCVL